MKLRTALPILILLGVAALVAILFREPNPTPPATEDSGDSIEIPGSSLDRVRPPVSLPVDSPPEPAPPADPGKFSPAPRAGTEAAYYQEYLAIFQQEDAAQHDLVGARLLEEGVLDPERIGILRASYDAVSPRCADLFLAALTNLPDENAPGLVSVPSFALRYLEERLGEDPVVREILEIAVFSARPPLSDALRRRALPPLIRTASSEDFDRWRRSLSIERDKLLLAGVAACLVDHEHPEAAQRLAHDLGLVLPPRAPRSEEE